MEESPNPPSAGIAGDTPDAQPATDQPQPEAIDPDSTVGTGSVFAIGCSILFLILTLIGVGIFISRQIN